MKKLNLISAVKTACTLFILIAVATACSNSASGDDDGHSEPEGLRLKMNGNTIVEKLPDSTVTGAISVTVGEETDQIEVWFIDHDGDEFRPDDPDLSLGHEFTAAGIAEFEQHDGKEWEFHIHGESEGFTELDLMLMHGDHSDFIVAGIQVNVEAVQE